MAEKEKPTTKPVRPLKRKLHINWNEDKQKFLVKKAFNFVPPVTDFTQDGLKLFLDANPDVEIVARYI